jgi:hypothetical protein
MSRPTPKATPTATPSPSSSSSSRGWLLLLLLPYLGLCFPGLYARATPTLGGFPFFYWYQFAWVLLTSAILGVVYRHTRCGDDVA